MQCIELPSARLTNEQNARILTALFGNIMRAAVRFATAEGSMTEVVADLTAGIMFPQRSSIMRAIFLCR